MEKKKEPFGRNGGRKAIPIDWREVDKALMAGAKGTDIADALDIHHDTFYARCQQEKGMLFSEYASKKRRKGDVMLHVAQFNNAMSGNTSMQVWLGKQRLGQKDDPKNENEFNGSLANLLDLMHLINTTEDFKALIDLAHKQKENKGEQNDGV